MCTDDIAVIAICAVLIVAMAAGSAYAVVEHLLEQRRERALRDDLYPNLNPEGKDD